jgi:diguanylate cyclase (GGDEF)-like protein
MTTTIPKILVVDDEADTRGMLCVSLESEEFDILEAKTGFSCISTVMSEAVDIILLDAMLPDIDGFKCCEILHERLQENCPPVLIITGLSDEESVNRAFEAQATDFITKPVNLSVLHHRIKRVLRERQLFRELEKTNSKLQQISRTDELTQLSNRRYFMAALNREWRRLSRERKPLSLLLCDLDSFKQFNDTYGHLEGDRCLQLFSQILRSCVERSTDVVARYGGEEFILLLPNTSLEGLEAIDGKIRAALKECAIPHRNSPVDEYMTFSAGGTTTVPFPTADANKLIADADQALYEAKARGRNCAVLRYHELSLA